MDAGGVLFSLYVCRMENVLLFPLYLRPESCNLHVLGNYIKTRRQFEMRAVGPGQTDGQRGRQTDTQTESSRERVRFQVPESTSQPC